MNKRNLLTPERIAKWSDEEVLTNLSTILTRANIATDFVTEELEEGTIITHEVLAAICGDKVLYSEPRPLDWPLQMLPVPEALQGTVH